MNPDPKVAPDGTAYDLAGPEDAPVLALIHGLGLCRHLWSDHLPDLSEHFRVLNYDLYGHGESAPAPATASLQVYADQLAGLMDHLKIPKATIVGFSIGGMINRRFVMDHAEKVEAMVVLNSPHDRGTEAQNMVEARARKVRKQGALATLDDALKRWFTPAYLASGERVGKVRLWREQVDPESYAQAAWVLANGVRELIRPAVAIGVPALIVTCENDTGSTVKMCHDIASEIEGSETVIIPGLQHLGLMEQPHAFTATILNFVKRTLK